MFCCSRHLHGFHMRIKLTFNPESKCNFVTTILPLPVNNCIALLISLRSTRFYCKLNNTVSLCFHRSLIAKNCKIMRLRLALTF